MIPFTPENFNKVMEKSNSRLIGDLKSMDYNSVDYYQISLQLREILEKKLPIEEFNKWMNYALELFQKYNINFNDYIKRLEFIKSNETLTSEFFKYCFILKNIKSPEAKDLKVITTAKDLFESIIKGFIRNVDHNCIQTVHPAYDTLVIHTINNQII